jgi:transposase
MSLHPQPIEPVPEQTAKVARAAFPKGNLCIKLRDEFGTFFSDDLEFFAPLFSNRGQSAFSPWRLALVSILQFVEGLSDQQAAEAVRSRIDWKYLLSLELTDPGFDASVLSEFRTRLVQGQAEQQLFEVLLAKFRERKLLKARGKQRTDSTHVLAAIRALNRVEVVGETMRYALNTLASVVPDWLQTQPLLADWSERYAQRFFDYRLPSEAGKRTELAQIIGVDGFALLMAIFSSSTHQWLAQIPALEILRQVWLQQYQLEEGVVRWRTDDNIPPASLFISSPYDVQAHYSKKRTTQWVGYKVHLTETCDTAEGEEAPLPHLIVAVQTTPAGTADSDLTEPIHQQLQAKQLLPATHLVDTGYVTAALLEESRRQYGVDLYGPTRQDYKWQAREGQGYEAANFQLDWEAQQATCPQGKLSNSWSPTVERNGKTLIRVKFSQSDCRNCGSRLLCTKSEKHLRRSLTLRPEKQYEALHLARRRELTAEFKLAYSQRAGVEGTISQGVRRCELRRSRYIGEAKTHLQHLLSAAALNFVRVGQWLLGETPRQTRLSPLKKLVQVAAVT